MKLLDSTFLVDYARGRDAVETYLAENDNETFLTSAINLKELAAGAHHVSNPSKQEFLADFGWLTVVPFDEDAAYHAGKIEADLRSEPDVYEHEIDSMWGDVLIAGVARSREVPVVTRNVDDFERFDGVSVLSY